MDDPIPPPESRAALRRRRGLTRPELAAVVGMDETLSKLNAWSAQERGLRGTPVRGWAPADSATVAATLDRSAAEVAALVGRNVGAVYSERYRIRKK